MLQTLAKNWWLLALCGAFDAIFSAIFLITQDADGSLALRTGFSSLTTIMLLGKLALAAGACAVAAGIWRSSMGKCWLLVLNGIALGVLGLLLNGTFGFKISFRTIALLIIVMAMSTGILELATAQTLRRGMNLRDYRILGTAGVISVAFALTFLALGFGWVQLEPRSSADHVWLGAYFVFSAICMLGLSLRLHKPGRPVSGSFETFLGIAS